MHNLSVECAARASQPQFTPYFPVDVSHLHTDQNCDKSEGAQNTETCRTEEILL